jgi:hypothetical protein
MVPLYRGSDVMTVENTHMNIKIIAGRYNFRNSFVANMIDEDRRKIALPNTLAMIYG